MAAEKNVDDLVQPLVLASDIETKKKVAAIIIEMAKSKNIFLSSIHDLYIEQGKGKGSNFTVPAMNLRSLTYYLAKAIFRVAQKTNAGAFIFEIAKSEMGYTDQPPIEYTGVILAAAIKEKYSGPIFIQGDHCQIKAKSYFADTKKEIASLKHLIEDAVSAGFFNIDVDTSTIVDLKKKTITEQQRDNFQTCAELTKFIRNLQPKGITISVGGEIGEVGGKNSTVEELKAFMEGYLSSLPQGTEGISKISVQTGTSHGGVVLADGSMAQVKVDLDTLKKLSAYAREVYHLGGAVQHGASTLPDNAFNKFPEVGTIEIHLATNFQNMIFDSPKFPKALKDKMYEWTRQNCPEERKEGQTEEQFIYKARKKALGAFKKDIMQLPEEIKEGIAAEIEKTFEFLFKQLNVGNTKDVVNKAIKPVDVQLNLRSKAVLDGEGDD